MQVSFGPFVLDTGTRQLLKSRREIHIAPKAFELLVALVQERPKVLSKAELQQRLWPETFVAEANLSNLVAEIREALGDQARAPRYIRTAHGFGYAFCAEATVQTRAGSQDPASKDTSARSTESPACWLEWGTRRLPLVDGENVVGRDADVEVRLDASTVSRRHARLTVTTRETTLEDFGSKNGTIRGDDRVTKPVHLNDGDIIHFGSLVLTYRVREALGSTETQGRGTSPSRRR